MPAAEDDLLDFVASDDYASIALDQFRRRGCLVNNTASRLSVQKIHNRLFDLLVQSPRLSMSTTVGTIPRGIGLFLLMGLARVWLEFSVTHEKTLFCQKESRRWIGDVELTNDSATGSTVCHVVALSKIERWRHCSMFPRAGPRVHPTHGGKGGEQMLSRSY